MYKGERLNSITHLVGAAMATIGLVVLVVLAARDGDSWKILSFSVYGATLLLLFVFSTLYHSFRGKAKIVFRKLDHHAIYLLIAGTYTPFTLVTLRDDLGWSLFGAVWGLAAIGIMLDSLPRRGRRILPLVIYLTMGWIGLIATNSLLTALPLAAVVLVGAGGLIYTAGVVFYVLDSRLRHAHGIWHLFVLAGSVTHYFAVVLYVA